MTSPTPEDLARLRATWKETIDMDADPDENPEAVAEAAYIDALETKKADAAASPVQVAIDTLTAIAHQTRTRGAGTEYEHTEPVDFADQLAYIVTAVAANVGSADQLIAGRPGSWEADLVYKLVSGTAGEDVTCYRTAPLTLTLNAEAAFEDAGLYDLANERTDAFDTQIQDATEAILETDTLPEEARERTRLHRELQAYGDIFAQRPQADRDRIVTIIERLDEINNGTLSRLREAGDVRVARVDAEKTYLEATNARYESDVAAYQTACLDVARSYLSEHGLPNLIINVVDFDNGAMDELGEAVLQHIEHTAKLPLTGMLIEFTPGNTSADQIRATGSRWPFADAEFTAGPPEPTPLPGFRAEAAPQTPTIHP